MSNQLYKAILKSVSGSLITYIIQFVALAFYSRFFTPEEFGIIASIQVFVLFFQILSDVGIGPAIINEEKFEPNKRDGVFTVTFILALVMAFSFYFFSYALNILFNGYVYQEIAFFVCIGVFFNSLSILPLTALNKDAKFMHISLVNVFAEIVTIFFVYFLYVHKFGVLALASKTAMQGALKFIMFWIISISTELGRAKLGKEIYHFNKILKFSMYQFGFNFINYFSRNLDNILIAKFFGMSIVGVYDKSYQLMRYPLLITTFAMAPAIQPALTRLRNNKDEIVREHNRLTCRLLAISLPISVYIYYNASSVILLLLGDKWLSVKPLIEIFSFMIPVQAVSSSSGSFFQAMNQPRLLFISGCLSACLNIAAIAFGVFSGDVENVAILLVLSFTINYFQVYYILFNYCFYDSLGRFLLHQLKAFIVVLPSILLYITIHKLIIDNEANGFFYDIVFNAIVGLLSISIFVCPIKKYVL